MTIFVAALISEGKGRTMKINFDGEVGESMILSVVRELGLA
jgi:hypothetical protein